MREFQIETEIKIVFNFFFFTLINKKQVNFCLEFKI